VFTACQSKYDKASKLFEQKEYLEAANLFKEVKSDDEHYSDAVTKLNLSYYQIGKNYVKKALYDSAKLFLDLVSSSDKIYPKALSTINFCNGIKAFNNNNLMTAKSCFTKMISDDEFKIEADTKLSFIEEKAKEQAQSLKSYFQKANKMSAFSLLDVGNLTDYEYEVNNYTKNLNPADEDIKLFIDNLKNYLGYKIEYARTYSQIQNIMDLPAKKLSQLESNMSACKNAINSILRNKGLEIIKAPKRVYIEEGD